MSETIDSFKRAVALFDSVVADVPADAWGNATPCEAWNASELVRHQCGVLDALAGIARSGEVNMPQMADETDDPAARWIETRDGLATALDGADLSAEDQYWFGPMSFEDFVGMVQWDPLAHSWDLAQSADIAIELPEDLCESSLARVKSLGEIPRKWKLITDEVPVPDGASAAQRYLAYVGRQP